MRGQGYDGAANMAGKFSGVRTRIQTVNQAVVKSCQLPIVRNTIDTVKDVSYAFHYSSKRTGSFKTMLQQADGEQLDALDGRRKIKVCARPDGQVGQTHLTYSNLRMH